ncbi:MAG: DUF4276 family protein [Phycisphaerae bacterium]
MRFFLFAEGRTEQMGLGDFLARWLNARLPQPVAVRVVKLGGRGNFQKAIAQKVAFHLARDTGGEVIAAVGLLDLYEGAAYPSDHTTAEDRYGWGVRHYEGLVGNERFRMFFAVHETEAWLLSDPGIFPSVVGEGIRSECATAPEAVDFDDPPAKRLRGVYRTALRKKYRKVVDGVRLFRKLDPQVAYDKCPYLKRMLDEILRLAREAGL